VTDSIRRLTGYDYGDLNGGFEAFLLRSEKQFDHGGTLPDDYSYLLGSGLFNLSLYSLAVSNCSDLN